MSSTSDAHVPMFLMGDPHRLRQVFLNLLSNAIKFTEKGSIHVAVTGRTAPDGRFALRVEVKDSGVGIPEEAKEKLFRPFVQADSSTTRQYGGTGLGLAICKRLIELMGGEIGFTSSPGKGSTFHFSVPLTVAVVGSGGLPTFWRPPSVNGPPAAKPDSARP